MKNSIFLKGFITILLLSCYFMASSQVKGISYTIAPTVEYVWWDNQSGLKDNFLVGGRLGIGFGENFELRGLYMQTINQKTFFNDFDLPNFNDSLFISRDVDITRWGGEIKANLSRGNLHPFVTLGTGIQSITLDSLATNEHIYVSLGAGLVFSIADRFTFTVEAKNTAYNFNAGKNLLTDDDFTIFDLVDDDFTNERLEKNWSVSAGLQFYLGGRRPGTMTELDEAYMKTFSGGLSGLRIPVEPTLAYINFKNSLPFRDTWLGGGYAGVDFNQYVGLRGFYFRAMEDDKVSLDFDELEMYGGEMRLKLNAGQGLTPYLILGGGYINVKDDYRSTDTLTDASSQAFAMGGLGITLPISSRFKLFGSARGLLTTGTDIEDLETSEQVKMSTMFTVGTRFIIGQKADSDEILQDRTDRKINAALAKQQKENKEKRNEIKEKYQTQIAELEKELNESYEKNDAEEAAKVLKKKEEAENVVKEIEQREKKEKEEQKAKEQEEIDEVTKSKNAPSSSNSNSRNNNSSESQIQMSPVEFQNLIESILENANQEKNNVTNEKSPAANQQQGNQLDDRQMQMMLEQQKLTQQVSQLEEMLQKMSKQQAEDQADDESQKIMEQQISTLQNKLKSMTEKQSKNQAAENAQDKLEREKLLKEIDELENTVIKMKERRAAQQANDDSSENDAAMQRSLTEFSAKLLVQMEKLNSKLELNNAEIQNLKDINLSDDKANNTSTNKTPTIIINENEGIDANETTVPYPSVTENNVLGVESGGDYIKEDSSFFSKLTYEGMSGFAGINVGGQTTFNAGFRWHYGIGDTKFELIPEAFFGFGSPSAFGITMNGVYNISIKNTPVTPYLGLGTGFMKIADDGDDELRLNYNFIFGSYVNVFKGRLYLDFTARNLFKFNQIIAGYRFAF